MRPNLLTLSVLIPSLPTRSASSVLPSLLRALAYNIPSTNLKGMHTFQSYVRLAWDSGVCFLSFYQLLNEFSHRTRTQTCPNTTGWSLLLCIPKYKSFVPASQFTWSCNKFMPTLYKKHRNWLLFILRPWYNIHTAAFMPTFRFHSCMLTQIS